MLTRIVYNLANMLTSIYVDKHCLRMIADKAEGHFGTGISVAKLLNTMQWIFEGHSCAEERVKLLSALSAVIPVMISALEVKKLFCAYSVS